MNIKQPKSCFVIMPFTVRKEHLPTYHEDPSHWDEVFEGLIQPAAAKAELTCERDDDDHTSRLIIDNIWQKIEAADVILCDLSATNPNVYLALGWALRADKRFVLIKDNATLRSFDLNQHFTVDYDHRLQPKVLKKDIEKLSNALVDTIQDKQKLYSIARKMGLLKKDMSLGIEFDQNPLVEYLLGKDIGLLVIRKQLAAARSVREFAFNLTPHSKFVIDELLALFKQVPQTITDLNEARAVLGLEELENDVKSDSETTGPNGTS